MKYSCKKGVICHKPSFDVVSDNFCCLEMAGIASLNDTKCDMANVLFFAPKNKTDDLFWPVGW